MTPGLGISALFAGEAGDRKDHGSEVLANHLRLISMHRSVRCRKQVYRRDEKNLRRLFDAAEDGGAILLMRQTLLASVAK